MRKLAIGVALATTALTPAMARDGAWYAGVEGGAMLVEDTDYDVNGINQDLTVDHDYGYNVDGIVGYDFGAFRIEAEVGYQSSEADEVIVGQQGIPGDILASSVSDINGDTSVLSFMLNGMLDFGDDDGIQGFVGGGAGVARVDENLSRATNFLDDSDTGFAYQAIAGVRAPLTDNFSVGLKYKFFTVPNVDLVSTAGDDYEGRYRSHSILGSLIFNFGAPAEAPYVAPPPAPPATTAPPPPPPPPPVQTCNNGPYIVFFDWDKSNLRPDAATVLDNAVAQYANCGSARVMLAGYTDTSGTKTYNVGLSQRRNSSVQSYLQSRGIPQARIATEAFGETNLRVPTADGVREPQNRRVEITYGPGAGY
ncbi:OmpA family protein [Novosphingopyxis sp.]|uniref:OmpA family protein n=1 Tax=Novosphingopyxis sp. TaxID=2709690 RepID=UPI003B594577